MTLTVLTRGSKGRDVEILQGKLKRLDHYKRKIDGRFGNFTREAVMDFQERYFCDGIVDEKTSDAIDAAVEAWSPHGQTILLLIPHGQEEVEARFGIIEYEETLGGYIWITDDWAERNIIRTNLPVVGVQSIHRKMEPIFAAVLDEIVERGLDGEIETFFCWCPRHQRHNPRLPLSTHSWAIAVDINAARNPPGTRGDLDPGIVEVFERFGFQWGGRWKWKDPMHFQYCVSY